MFPLSMSGMRPWLAVLVVCSTTGCIGAWRRDQVTAQRLREHYATTGAPARAEKLRQLWEALEPSQSLGCLSVLRPCRDESPAGSFCFRWGEERSCFKVNEANEQLQLTRADETHAEATERWLYSTLDPSFDVASEAASAAAEEQVRAEERLPADPNTFWAAARGAVQIPQVIIGLQVQGGYRRWLDRFLLLSVGGGYERTLTTTRGLLEPRDAALLTARLELSTYDPLAKHRAHLPFASLYLGLTGVLGVTPAASWGTRAYVGFSAIVPLSFEVGWAVSSLPSATLGQLYLGVGFGI
ncbi:MAG TPA: hypothetical protein VGE37_14510 [Archangium sp.]